MSLEFYGDPNLNYSNYPGMEFPNSCGAEADIGIAGNDTHGHGCGAPLAGGEGPCSQQPYSMPYQPEGQGPQGAQDHHHHQGQGHQISLTPSGGARNCRNPLCNCPNCDGNCNCGALLALAQAQARAQVEAQTQAEAQTTVVAEAEAPQVQKTGESSNMMMFLLVVLGAFVLLYYFNKSPSIDVPGVETLGESLGQTLEEIAEAGLNYPF